jgi:outer membrane protein TolC
VLPFAAIITVIVHSMGGSAVAAQEALPPPLPAKAIGVQRLTLEEAKQCALTNSKALALASMNVQSKDYASRATRADYFPKIVGSVIYFHFDEDLGSVLTIHGHPRLGIPATAVAVNVINQDQSLSTVSVAQPITALLKIRQGVIIASRMPLRSA